VDLASLLLSIIIMGVGNIWHGAKTRLGHHLDTTWTPPGHHLDTTWTPLGHYMDTIWTLHGHHLDTTWTPLGHYMDTTWTTLRQHSARTWTTFGQHLNMARTKEFATGLLQNCNKPVCSILTSYTTTSIHEWQWWWNVSANDICLIESLSYQKRFGGHTSHPCSRRLPQTVLKNQQRFI